MVPGRELDALVAEKVMGLVIETRWRVDGEGHNRELIDYPVIVPEKGAITFGKNIPKYSTDIAAAWEVAEASLLFKTLGFYLWNDGECWCVGETNGVNDCSPHVKGQTAPHAICLAALRAVGVEV